MKKLFLVLLTALPVLAAKPWKLAWSDEFNGARKAPPDSSKWAYDWGDGGWGNHELEVYTKSPENVFQDGRGHLVIRTVKTDSGRFTSARIKTQGKFSVTYGKIAARMKVPRGQGLWPAFWMLGQDIGSVGWPKCGEIDVMENIGKEPTVVHGTMHGPGYSGKAGISAQYSLPNARPLFEKFHVYAVEWTPGKVEFFFDGKSYATVTPASLPKGAKWVYDHPFFLLLNVAVGGAWPGNPDQTTHFPQELAIDWVRVWQ